MGHQGWLDIILVAHSVKHETCPRHSNVSPCPACDGVDNDRLRQKTSISASEAAKKARLELEDQEEKVQAALVRKGKPSSRSKIKSEFTLEISKYSTSKRDKMKFFRFAC